MEDRRKRKILIVVPTLVPGGSERFASTLFNQLDRTKFDVRLFVPRSGERFYKLNYPNEVINSDKKNVRSSFFVLLKTIRRERPDVVFSTITSLNILLSFIRFIYPWFILVIRESTILSIYYKRDVRWSFFYEIPIRMFYRFADKIVCQSRDMMNDLLLHYHAVKSSIAIINNPVEINDFPVRTMHQNRRLKLVTVARLDPSKGFNRIISALAKLKVDFEYTIVGDFEHPKLRPEFDRMMSHHNLHDKVKLVGVTHEPHNYLREADVYVHGSYYEGFPNVVLEAGATGLPVVSFNTTGIGELLEDGVNGFVVEEGNEEAFAAAIERAAHARFDPAGIRAMTEAKFNMPLIIGKYEDLLQSVQKGRSLLGFVSDFIKNKDLFFNTSHNYLNKALNALTPIFLIPYFNKMFGVEQFGVLIYIQAIATLMIYISDYGFVYTGTREVSVNADNPERLSRLVSAVMVVKVLLTIGIFLALFGVSYLNDLPGPTVLLYTLTFTALTLQNFMPSWFFQGMKKNFIITLSNIISKVLLVTLVIVFIQPGSQLWIVPLIEGISYFLFFGVGMALVFYSFKIKFKLPDWNTLVHNFSLGKDTFLVTLMSWTTTSGILVMTEQFVASQPFGYYGVFTRICYYIFIGVHQINLSVFPYISERFARSWDEGQRLYKSMAGLFGICVVGLLLGGLLLGKLAFNIFFDANFNSSLNEYIPVFYLLVLRIALLLANSYLGLQFFVATKNDKIYRNSYVINVVVSIVACLVLVQWSGIMGAAIAACAGEAVMFFFMVRNYYAVSSRNAVRA